jgi:uncharacterized iron-regulated membrane protein
VLRRTIFWAHLACGVTAGLVILMMSATGVLLTYERQLLEFSERRLVSEPAGRPRMALGELLEAARRQEPSFAPSSIALSADPRAPVKLSAGRGSTRLLDPYTGAIVGDGEGGLHAFFAAVRGWHRWFNVDGEGRDVARAVTGACNLAFLFLVLSGSYLWLPPAFNRVAFRVRLWFNPKARGGKARDYNWHHVLGIWSVLPLAVIVASATVFYYEWANDAVYRAFGEQPPPQGRGAAGAPAAWPASARVAGQLDALAAQAATAVQGWRSLSLELPGAGGTVRVTVDRGTGGQPQHRHELVLDAATGEVLANERFPGTPGRQARSILRFLHTGEVLGIAGQTVAGIVSATSTVMVWTGLALAWRRLVRPLLTRRRLAPDAP